jgi:glycerate kinase
VVLLEARLTEWSAELKAVAGRDVGAESGAGAAGASVPRFWRWVGAASPALR